MSAAEASGTWATDDLRLPPGGAAYLRDVRDILRDAPVRCVLAFGSVVSGGGTAASDVDLLVVLPDAATEQTLRSVRERCAEAAERHLAAARPANALERLVDAKTGAFRSAFACRERDVRTGRFHRMFNTTRLAYLLAPWRTVAWNAFARSRVLTGEPVAPDWDRVGRPQERRARELLRSLAMTMPLALAQCAYALASRRAVLYSMEAYKWTAHNVAFHASGKTPPGVRAALAHVADPLGLHARLLELREMPRRDWRFILLAPLAVLAAHVAALARSRGRRENGEKG